MGWAELGGGHPHGFIGPFRMAGAAPRRTVVTAGRRQRDRSRRASAAARAGIGEPVELTRSHLSLGDVELF